MTTGYKLRDVTKSMNMQNLRSARSDSTSGLLGAAIDRTRGKWIAQITTNGKTKRLGHFDSADEAHAAYIAAKRIMHPGCTI